MLPLESRAMLTKLEQEETSYTLFISTNSACILEIYIHLKYPKTDTNVRKRDKMTRKTIFSPSPDFKLISLE